ncbi:MAG TPA: hypothetical protein VK183_09785 [Flavobacterium sp.]|nr:hypothetical protein [Flavobacterium sp.]
MATFSFSGVRLDGMVLAIPKASDGTRISAPQQTASDLGYEAAVKLLSEKGVSPSEIGAVLFLSRTPDYRSPATSIVLQGRLGIPVDCLAFDMNLGGAGFVYGLQVGCSLLESLTTSYALVFVADTVNRQLAPDQKGQGHNDAATAILLRKAPGSRPLVVQTFADSQGFTSWMIREGGFRKDDPTATDNLPLRKSAGQFIKEDKEAYNAILHHRLPESLAQFLEARALAQTDFTHFAASTLPDGLKAKIKDATGIVEEKWAEVPEATGSTATWALVQSGQGRALVMVHGEGISWGFADLTLEADAYLDWLETDAYFDNGFVTHEMPS